MQDHLHLILSIQCMKSPHVLKQQTDFWFSAQQLRLEITNHSDLLPLSEKNPVFINNIEDDPHAKVWMSCPGWMFCHWEIDFPPLYITSEHTTSDANT